MKRRKFFFLFFLLIFAGGLWLGQKRHGWISLYAKAKGISAILHGKKYLYETMEQMWGSFFTRGQVFTGDYFYVGMALNLAVFDVRNPERIVLKTHLPVDGTVHYMVRDGNTLYAAAGDAGVLVLDITHREKPRILSTLQEGGYARNVSVSSGTLYVAYEKKGLGIVDVRNKQKPVLTAYVKAGSVTFVKVRGNVAYLSVAGEGLVTVDVTQPEKPEILSRTKIPGDSAPRYVPMDPPPYDVAPVQDYAYMANGYHGVSIINVKNPRKPVFVKNVNVNGFCHNITVKDTHAFVTVQPGTILMLDVRDPENPVPVKEIPGFGGYAPFVFSGNRAIFQKERTSFSVVDSADALSPRVLGTYASPPSGQGITVSGGALYLSDGSAGLKIFSLEKPDNPSFTGTLDTTAFVHRTSVSLPYAYLADGLGGVVVADVRNSHHPVYVTSYNFQQHPWDIALADHISYLATGSMGLALYDITNSRAPSLLSSVRIPNDYVTALAYENRRVFVGGLVSGLYIFNVNDARHPVLTHSMFGQITSLRVKKNVVFISNPLGFIEIVRVREKPVKLATLYAGGKPMGLWLDENTLYSANAQKGLFVFDVTHPDKPRQIARYALQGHPYDVTVKSGYAYVADGEKELAVINLKTGQVRYWHKDF